MTRWSQVTIAVLGGIAAALHVGKVPPALPLLREELGLSLVAAGWLMGLVAGIGALLGVVIGRVADRLTHRRSLALGLALLALGSLGGAIAGSSLLIFATRVVESVGLIMTVVAAPGLITTATDPRDRGVAFALWAAWMPFGVGIMMLVAPPILGEFGWRGVWIAACVATAAPLVALLLSTPLPAAGSTSRLSLLEGARLTAAQPVSWILSGIFLAYSASFMSVFGFLPTMLVEEQGLALGLASVMTALAVLANAGGNLLGGVLLRRGSARWVLVVTACVMLTLTAFLVFSEGLPLSARYGGAVLYAVTGGLLPATIMGALPIYAPRAELVSTMSGFVMQGTNIGQLMGPLFLASIVSAWGWPAAPFYVGCATAMAFVLALLFRRIELRRVRAAAA